MATKKIAAPETTNKSKLGDVEKLAQQVFPKSQIYVDMDPNSFKESRPHIPTGSLVLDWVIGGTPNDFGILPCPGWPKGAIINIYGHESSGKSTVSLMAAAEVIKAGGSVLYIDWENAVDLSYAKVLGVPVEDKTRFALQQPETLEMGIITALIAVKRGVELVVFDSVGAALPQVTTQRAIEEQTDSIRIGLVAQKWSQSLPQLATAAAISGSTIIGISQMRKKIATGPMASLGDGTTTQGGEAWKYFSSVRAQFKKIGGEKGKVYNPITNKTEEQIVANKILVKLDKCKVSASAHHTGEVWITFGKGIDNFRTAIEVCSLHGIIKKAGAGWYTWERPGFEPIKVQGLPELKRIISEQGLEQEFIETARQLIIKSALGQVKTPLFASEPSDEEREVLALLGEGFLSNDIPMDLED
jgi:recombination protein RecA